MSLRSTLHEPGEGKTMKERTGNADAVVVNLRSTIYDRDIELAARDKEMAKLERKLKQTEQKLKQTERNWNEEAGAGAVREGL